jgi:hypothetical protein
MALCTQHHTMAKMHERPLLIVVGLFLLTGACGCARRDLYPVRGRVVFDQGGPIDPLAGGLVIFEPLDPKMKVSARGDIQPDGSFRLSTFQQGDGAPLGEYRVLVSPPTPPSQAKEIPAPVVIHPRFHDLEKTPLRQTVRPEANELTLTVAKP